MKERVVANAPDNVYGPRAGLGRLGLLLVLALAAGAAAAEDQEIDRDPFEAWNRPVHNFNETLDVHILQPVARGYRAITPSPVERAVSNFFDNLTLPLSIVGGLLQLDSERTLKETGRFVVNSTVGLAGLFDPATSLGLERQEEDIGQALESWGAKNSPYLVLPFLGPMTLVQIPDRIAAPLIGPTLMGGYWHDSLYVLSIISTRAELLSASAILDESAADSYIFTREAFLQRRRYLLYNGEPPLDDFDAFFDEF
ncbi:MAG: VacJ family lipoprotein [Gammaproteobacteria bacterium]|nr:VacJ family lipoprotein [Gammaproteobacteria bacterium]